MKVAFVNQPWNTITPPVESGSIAIWTYEIARRVARSTDVVVYGKREVGQSSSQCIDNIQYRRVSVSADKALAQIVQRLYGRIATRSPFFASMAYYGGYITRVAWDLRQQCCDIVHIQNFPQFIPVIRSLNPRAKIVLHMHCEWLTQLDRDITARRLRHADMILGCSQYITSKIKERFPDLAARCDTVPNGVDVEFFEQKRETTPTPGNGQVRLLFVGRVSPEKGLHTLIDAFLKVQRHHLQIKLEIIGPDAATPVEFLVALSAEDHVKGLAEFYDGNYLSYLKNRAACKSGQVSFIGHVPYRALPAYYQRADILVNPSFSESFGMSLIEGMASGLPVVATRIGGMIETVEHGKTGMLVNVGRSDELADAIRHLVEDGKLRRRMGAAGYHRVRSLFSWDRVADRVRCCYDKLIRQASETLV